MLDEQGRPLEGAFAFLTGVGPYSDSVVERASTAYRAIDGRGALHEVDGERTSAAGRAILAGRPGGVAASVAAIHPEYEPATSRPITTVAGRVLAVEVRMRARPR